MFVWHGDLNYFDASGPLAQRESGYAGVLKDLLAVVSKSGDLLTERRIQLYRAP